FTISIEAAHDVTTGISAFDRAHTISVAANPQSGPKDIVSPGHIFPIRAQSRGVFDRQGQTEGSVDLALLAGMRPCAVICEVLKDDGTIARRDDLDVFSKAHDFPLVSIEEILQSRLKREAQERAFAGLAPKPTQEMPSSP